MKKNLLLAAAFALCTVLSVNTFAQKNKTTSSCGEDVTNLSLNVYDFFDSTVHNLRHDGVLLNGKPAPYTTYKTKREEIVAMFQQGNCSMDFTLNLNASPRYMLVLFPDNTTYQAKFYNFDRVASVPVTPTTIEASNNFLQSQFCTAQPEPLGGTSVGRNADGTYKDNYGGCGVDANGHAYVRRNVGIGLDDATRDDYRLRFQYSPIDGVAEMQNLVSETSFIKVYHPDENTWILTPESETNPTTGITGSIGAKLQNLDKLYLRGTYSMPFRFILKKGTLAVID